VSSESEERTSELYEKIKRELEELIKALRGLRKTLE